VECSANDSTRSQESTEMVAYKPEKKPDKKTDADDAIEVLGDYERPKFGSNFVQVSPDSHIPVWEYFGSQWTGHIVSNSFVSYRKCLPEY